MRNQAFNHGVRSLRTLILEEIDKRDNVMPHEHNPDVQEAFRWEYCWRCKIERVLNGEITAYHPLEAPKASPDSATPAHSATEFLCKHGSFPNPCRICHGQHADFATTDPNEDATKEERR